MCLSFSHCLTLAHTVSTTHRLIDVLYALSNCLSVLHLLTWSLPPIFPSVFCRCLSELILPDWWQEKPHQTNQSSDTCYFRRMTESAMHHVFLFKNEDHGHSMKHKLAPRSSDLGLFCTAILLTIPLCQLVIKQWMSHLLCWTVGHYSVASCLITDVCTVEESRVYTRKLEKHWSHKSQYWLYWVLFLYLTIVVVMV